MDIDQINEGIRELVTKEIINCIQETELQLSCRPACLDRCRPETLTEIESLDDYDWDFRAINLRKMVMEFIKERDGRIDFKDESDWLKAWAKEFEMYAKRCKKQATKLEMQAKATPARQ